MPTTYRLMRQGDDGHEHEIERNVNLKILKDSKNKLEKIPHKQIYWIEAADG